MGKAAATDFNLSDEDEDEGTTAETEEVEEEEEEESEEEGEEGDADEGDESKPGTAAHRRARGDAVEEEEADEEIDEESLAEIAGEGKRKTTLLGRVKELTRQRDAAVDASIELVKSVAGSKATPAAKVEAAPAYDFKAKRREANKLLLEGDEEGAAAIQDEMDTERDRIAQANADARADARVSARLEEQAALAVCGEIFERMPYLNLENKGTFNAEAMEDFETLRDGFLKKGETLSEAMRKAANKTALLHADLHAEEDDEGQPAKKNGKKVKRVEDDDEQDDDEQDAGKRSTNKQILERLRKNTIRNAKAENRQPPQLSRAGIAHRDRLDVTKINVEKLTDEQWDALPDDVKKQLRGDRLSA